MTTNLFLFGGGPPFTNKLAERFRKIAKKHTGKVVVLYIEKNLQKDKTYTKKYINTLRKKGYNDFCVLPLGTTKVAEVVAEVENSAGIIIGAGNTLVYAKHIVDTAIGKAIKDAYERGVPVAGFSAGALISPNECVISPRDNKERLFKQRKGLGLLNNTVLVAHYQQWEESKHLRETATAFPTFQNYGINEHTGIYFRDGTFFEMEGDGVFTIIDQQLHAVINKEPVSKLKLWQKIRNFFLKVR
ncbi:Type 1 glutamine amidotransferase-like domain-containing protein [Brochothrix thermosphacta]|uniref:Type 1 glutamine amidotransferase-like domain-containing protein n=1 Tax=Brochothrix thermosphacta TaxID=2756 RepID=UPI000D7AB5F4|nr:Type 1 glutamine amidotransferase-like domain-containing protein [Brochothrix thermosphacta]WKK69761.1 Type 1 glutamine amidotransferase-like domain-containing protein [Brochothrix thermosphacta]SPN76442.1 putative peptidase [Brochothrix thermosphacta]